MWAAQLYACKAKKLWNEEQLVALGMTAADDFPLSQQSQEEDEAADGGAALAVVRAGKRAAKAKAQGAGDVKKPKRESPPADCPCVPCWNLSRGNRPGAGHTCSRARTFTVRGQLEVE